MDRIAANYLSLNADQRRGLLVIVMIAVWTSLCIGASCTAKSNVLMGAGLGGAAGFAISAVLIAALLRWGIAIDAAEFEEKDLS